LLKIGEQQNKKPILDGEALPHHPKSVSY